MSLALPMLRDRDRVLLVEPGRLHPAVSFARASTATYMGPAGALLTAAVNMPRFEYDSLGNYLGLLIEEARTNSLLNSATLSTQSVSVTAAARTLSFYGTGTVTLTGTFSGSLAGTGASNRVTLTFTPTAGTLTLTVSGSVTSAQLELGSFVTSYISTVGSAVTRSKDVAVASPFTSLGITAATGTIYVEGDNGTPSTDASVRLAIVLYDTTALNNALRLERLATTGLRVVKTIAGSSSVQSAAYTTCSLFKMASSYGSSAGLAAFNGAVSSLTSGAPTSATSIGIGSVNGSNPWFGHIKRAFWSSRQLPSVEMQRLTT